MMCKVLSGKLYVYVDRSCFRCFFCLFFFCGKPGSEVIKLFSCSTQLSMKFLMLISIKKIARIQLFAGSDKPRCYFFCSAELSMKIFL